MESILGEAWVMIQANIEPALKQVSAFMEKVAATEVIITTRADTSQVVRSYDAVKAMARDLRPVIALGVDGAAAVRGIDAIETMARDARPVMTVMADTAPALRQVAALRAEMSTATIGAAGAGAAGAGAAAGSAAEGGALGGAGMVGQLKGFAEVLGVLEGVHGIVSAAKDTQEFQTRLVDLATGAGEATSNLDMISAGLKSISTQVGVSAVELEKGLYFIESDGAHGADALTVLKAAAEGARTGLADMEDVTTGLMTVMRSYEIPFNKATQTTSALVEAVAHGGVRLADFAQGMKTVAPIAAAFNVPLNQVLGAMSTITSITHNAASGATGLRYILNTFAAPSKVAAHALGEIGISADQVEHALHDQGLVGALKLVESHLSSTFPGDAVKANAVLHDVFGGTRGMTAGVELTNQHLTEMIANIGDISAKSGEAGDSVAGWSKITKTLSYNVDVIKASLVRFGIEAGTFVLPGVTLLLRGVIGLADGIGKTLGLAIAAVRPEWEALMRGFDASPGDNLGGGLLGWISRLGERVHGVASDIKGTWNGVTGALSGKTPTGPAPGGIVGRVTGIAAGARSAWGDFTGALHGRTPALTTLTSTAAGLHGPGTAAQLRDMRAEALNQASAPKTGLAGAATSVGSTLRDVGKDVYPAMTLISAGFKGSLDPKGFTNWEGAAVRAGQLAKDAFDGAKTAIGGVVSVTKGAIEWGLKHKTLIKDLAIGVVLVVTAINAWQLATKALAAVQLLLDAAMDANPVGLIIVGIGLLVGSLIYAYQKVGWFRDGVQTAFHFVAKVGSEVWSVLSDGIHAFTAGPLAWIKDEIGKFSDVWKEKSDQIREIWNFLWTAIKVEFEIYWIIFSTAFKLALETVGIVWHAAWDFIKNDFTLIWGAIRDTLGFFLDLLRNSIVLFIDLVTGKWGKVWGDCKKLVGDAFGDIGKLFSDFAKNALTLLYDAGKDVIGGLIKGMTDGGKTVWNAVKDVASSVVDGVKHFFGIKSPSTVMAGLGGNIMAGLIKGILASGSGMGGILDKIFSGALDDPWGWLAGHLSDLGGIISKVPGLATALAKKAASGALHGLEHLGGDVLNSIFGGGGKGLDVSDLIGESLAINGLPPGWSKAMAELVSKESGGNPNAVNPTPVGPGKEHATGIGQMLPSTFHANMLAGFGDIFSALDNLISSERYIKSRYGSPDRIPNLFGGKYVGYDAGGILPPGASLVINKTGSGEPTAVFTPDQWSAIQSLADRRSGGSATPVVNIQVLMGTKDITDVVDTRIDHKTDGISRTLRGGAKRR